MIEEPLDRLNYYNGQRLEASDLKLEQQYHIRVRRWINKSLYTPGIASGLDVRAEANTRFVVVGPGMALDPDGREILLLEEERIFVPGSSSATGSFANPQGLYLTIRYDEEPIQEESNQCVPQSKNGKNGNQASWGGPALLRAKPLFNWSDALPYDSSGEVVLAQVALDSTCTYAIVNPGVRRYVGDASSAKVRQYALEGEREIDQNNSGKIYFHVRGRQPNAVTLYLRGDLLSTLHYTELGNHSHGIDSTGYSLTIPAHTHTLDGSSGHTGQAGGHNHTFGDIRANVSGVLTKGVLGVTLTYGFTQLSVSPPDATLRQASLRDWAQMNIELNPVGDHSHSIPGSTDPVAQQTVSLSGTGGANPAGVWSIPGSPQPVPAPYLGRSGPPLTYVTDLHVEIDKRDVTQDIINQLKGADSTWVKLGDAVHALKDGTGEIKLDFLPGISFLEGEHLIELSVSGDGNGGRILYNLYVE